MFDLEGHPVLEWCVRACRFAPGVDEVWVATSTLPVDNVIEEWCHSYGIDCYRGSETDVLERFVGVAVNSNADVLLRLTGDCPFLDPTVIGGVVRLMRNTGAQFCTNVSPRTYPDGLDVQAFTADALFAAEDEATRPIDRDGVCTWIERNRSRFPAETLINPIPGLAGERWVMDTADDYEFCKQIADRFGWYTYPPTQLDILGILDREPELRNINKHHPCNERYYEALAKEPIYERTYERSQAQFAYAKEVIPLAAQTFSKSHLQYPQPSALFVTHGDGGLVWDIDGNEYVDLVSALLPNVLGYRDADVDWAVRRQLASGISFSLATELEAQLAETLCRLIPCAEMVRFGKTGSDVTSAAVRLARAYRGNIPIIIADGGYHGWHDWTVWGTIRGEYGIANGSNAYRWFIDEILRYDLSRLGAVIVEPDAHPVHQLRELRRRCTETGCVLIFDEIITGFRFDLGGAQKLYDVIPDLACFGKAMANGMPISAVVGQRDIMKRMEPPDNIFYSGTFFGETLSIAAAIATIDKLERDNIIPQLWKTGGRLRSKVDNLIDQFGLTDTISLQGCDVLVRVKIPDEKFAALFRREMMKTGVLITNGHNICAAHGPSEIARVLASYEHTLTVMREVIDHGSIDVVMDGANVAEAVRS